MKRTAYFSPDAPYWRAFNRAAFIGLAIISLTCSAFSQNPSYAGREFRRVFEHGTVPQGAPKSVGVTQAFLAESTVYFQSNFDPQGFYRVDETGAYSISNKYDPGYEMAMNWLFMGFTEPNTVLFVPVTFNNILPVYTYGPSGLAAVSSPTPEQGLNYGNYFDGRMVYYRVNGNSGAQIWQYEASQPDTLLYNVDNFPGLNGFLDYDGESMVLSSGEATVDATVWLRLSDGTLKPIIKEGDPLPGSEGTYTGLAVLDTAHVSQERVYMLAESKEKFPFFSDRTLWSSDGNTTEVIATRGMAIPGQGGAILDGFDILDVLDGKVWLNVSQSPGGKSVYAVKDGVWDLVASSAMSFDGRTPVALQSFKHGMRGDTVAILVSFLQPNFTLANDLYVNGPLPGFNTTGGGNDGPPLTIVPGPNGSMSLSFETQTGKIYTLQSSADLSGWNNEQDSVVGDGSTVTWTLNNTGGTRYFRVEVVDV